MSEALEDRIIYSVIVKRKTENDNYLLSNVVNSCFYYLRESGITIQYATLVAKVKKLESADLELVDLDKLKSQKINKYLLPDNYCVRYAVNPNLAPTLMNLKGVIVHKCIQEANEKGLLYLRFDDTSPDNKPSLIDSYESYCYVLNTLNLQYVTYYVSDYLQEYYKVAKQLLVAKKAYLKYKLNKTYQLVQFERFLKGNTRYVFIIDGLKPWVGLRQCVTPHVRKPTYKIWPTLNFHSTIDDAKLGVTHIYRGADLKSCELIQTEFLNTLKSIGYFKRYTLPTCTYWGRNKIIGALCSSSKIAKLADYKNDLKEVFKDPRCPTIDNLEYYGISLNAVNKFWREIGVSPRPAVINLNLLKMYCEPIKPTCMYTGSGDLPVLVTEHITNKLQLIFIDKKFKKQLRDGMNFGFKNFVIKYVNKKFVKLLVPFKSY